MKETLLILLLDEDKPLIVKYTLALFFNFFLIVFACISVITDERW